MASDLHELGWPEQLHENHANDPEGVVLRLLGLTALCAGLGQQDPVTAALDIMRTRTDEQISPVTLRALVEEFDAR